MTWCQGVLQTCQDTSLAPLHPHLWVSPDFMPLLPAPTFSTLGSLTLSHSVSGVQPSIWDRTPAATVLGEMLTLSCDGSFILGGLCLGQGLSSHRTGACEEIPSPSQESYLCLGQEAFLPCWAVLASSIHESALSPSSFHGLAEHLLCSRPEVGTRILR